jgi:hypothetical protein
MAKYLRMNLEYIREVGVVRWTWRTCLRQLSKRLLRVENTLVLPTGLLIHLPKHSKFGSEVFVTKANVDWGSERIFAENLDPSGVFLDVGANIGYYSLYVLPCVSSAYAFEPGSACVDCSEPQPLRLYQRTYM